MIAIIDYGMGNLASVQKAFAFLGFDARITDNPADIAAASQVVLPGVGAFRDAIAALRAQGLDKAFRAAVEAGKPCLGICLGMQLLFEKSLENGEYAGLGLLPGTIERLPESEGVKVPHMGWNDLTMLDEAMFADIRPPAHAYYVHSYGFLDTQAPFAAAVCRHGVDFVCAVRRGNLWGAQFHPEKSGDAGLGLLRNFVLTGDGRHA